MRDEISALIYFLYVYNSTFVPTTLIIKTSNDVYSFHNSHISKAQTVWLLNRSYSADGVLLDMSASIKGLTTRSVEPDALGSLSSSFLSRAGSAI